MKNCAFAFLNRYMAENYVRIPAIAQPVIYSSGSLELVPAIAPRPGYLRVGD
jgi:hypothetical protein